MSPSPLTLPVPVNHRVAVVESTAVGQHWAQVSSDWEVERSPHLGRLVVPTGNATAPVHRWFHLKEAYSKDLLPAVLEMVPNVTPADRSLSIVDPFSGVGTSMLSAIDLKRDGKLSSLRGVGIEVNPFLHFIGEVKARSAISGKTPDVAALKQLATQAKSLSANPDEFPTLSTFHKSRYFPPDNVAQLVQLRKAIAASGLDDLHRGWANLALAMTVEPASRLRRDGRTLRYEAREPSAPLDVFGLAVERITADLTWETPLDANVRVVHGTSVTTPWPEAADGTVDLVLFSPPYPNNIDYTEVYKIELWALSFVADSEAFREQRQATMRSHPSVKFRRPLAYESDPRGGSVGELIEPVLSAIPAKSRYARSLKRMIEGYADDMLVTFDSAYRALRPGGSCVYVVGNSVHGTTDEPVLVASDVILARLAELAGFEVGRIHVARDLPRRRVSSQFVRESVVVLHKC